MRTIYLSTLVSLACLMIASTALSGQPKKMKTQLSGGQEEPLVLSDGSGDCEASFNKDLTEAKISLKVKKINEDVVAAHFHCAPPGENGPVAFGLFSPGPLTYDAGKGKAKGTLTSTDFTGGDCVPVIGRPVNNIAALAYAMREGLIYCNIHTSTNPGGEIRGQLSE